MSTPRSPPAARFARSRGRLRRVLPIAALALAGGLTLMAVTAANAGSFADGVAAESRGDLQAAVTAYRQAAQQGEAPAEFALGRLSLDGRGTPQDYAAALDLFGKAAAQGNPGAQYQLALMRQLGQGGPQDAAAAAQWLLKSAGQGYEPAEVSLAEAYDRGAGVPKDLDQAIRWATSAAQRGDVTGELEAGRLYLEAGRQVAKTAARLNSSQFHVVMDTVFGPKNWRETGGYRPPARENELRTEGAETVPAGMLSRHSLGTPQAPGAYDVVVARMSTADAAVRLLSSGVRFRRVFPEGAHGSQGPHLHIEPLLGGSGSPPVVGAPSGGFVDQILSSQDPVDLQSRDADYQQAKYWLDLAARNGSAEASTVLLTLPTGSHAK